MPRKPRKARNYVALAAIGRRAGVHRDRRKENRETRGAAKRRAITEGK